MNTECIIVYVVVGLLLNLHHFITPFLSPAVKAVLLSHWWTEWLVDSSYIPTNKRKSGHAVPNSPMPPRD
jgi:hypothetical protein